MALRGGPIGLHDNLPVGSPCDSAMTGQSDNFINEFDGLVMIIGAVEDWRFVITSSGKLGWVESFDLGVSGICESVYHVS